MELIIKLDREDLEKHGEAVRKLIRLEMPIPEQKIGPEEPKKEDPEEPKKEDPEEPKKEDPEALRAKIRVVGGNLAAAGKGAELIQIFHDFGVEKLRELKDEDLEEALKRMEAV